MAATKSQVPTSRVSQVDRQALESLLEQMFTMEPGVLEEDIDFVRMRAVVRLKRRIVTGEVSGGYTQSREHQPIFECPVMHFKNKYGLNRIRYKKGDDVTVMFSSRAKDWLVYEAHKTNVHPQYKRAFDEQDAFVLLGFLADIGEPLAPKDKSDELGLNRIEMGQDDWVHYWGRFGTPGWGARIYTTPQGDHVIHPRIFRNVYLEEKARYHILFAEPVASDHNNHGNFGMPGPGDPPTLPAFWYFPVKHWSLQHWVDNAFNF